MSNLFFKIMERLTPELRLGNLAVCETAVADTLQSLPESPFHCATQLTISNDPNDAASHFDRFLERESSRYTVAAVYTEMNEFDINPDRWYCDLFAFTSYRGPGNYDWLSDCHSGHFEDYTITGLEELQAVYASGALGIADYDDAKYIASLLVLVKFQSCMDCAAQSMQLLTCPLLIAGHEFEFISESRKDT